MLQAFVDALTQAVEVPAEREFCNGVFHKEERSCAVGHVIKMLGRFSSPEHLSVDWEEFAEANDNIHNFSGTGHQEVFLDLVKAVNKAHKPPRLRAWVPEPHPCAPKKG